MSRKQRGFGGGIAGVAGKIHDNHAHVAKGALLVQIGEPRGFAGEHGADCQFQISGCGGGHMRMRMLRLRLLHVSKTGTTFYSSIFSLIVVAQNKTKQKQNNENENENSVPAQISI